MKRSKLMAATAWAAFAALGAGETAQAALPEDYAQAVLRVRQHVQALKRTRAEPAGHGATAPLTVPITAMDIPARAKPWWDARSVPVQYEAVPEYQYQPFEPEPPRPRARPAQLAEPDGASRQQQAAAPEGSSATPPDAAPPGVLTRQGTLVLEPSIEYTHTDINRFVVGGVAILDTVLVGSIEASQADRDAVTATLGMRYGVTDRIEAELRVPYMYRNDATTNSVISTNQVASTTDLDSHGLGDIEGALHWQMNDGTGSWPFLVANLRVKSTTGTGPFDVDRDAAGTEQELATGSGFWGVEPSLTVIAPSDPAVFYANLGYLWNAERDIDKTVANNRVVRSVDPGDAIRLGFGMGLALNEKVSFSVGYQHDWIMQTQTEFTDATFESESLSVGSLTLGANWQMTDSTALNVSVGIGVTEDAPDLRMMARMPIALDLFGK